MSRLLNQRVLGSCGSTASRRGRSVDYGAVRDTATRRSPVLAAGPGRRGRAPAGPCPGPRPRSRFRLFGPPGCPSPRSDAGSNRPGGGVAGEETLSDETRRSSSLAENRKTGKRRRPAVSTLIAESSTTPLGPPPRAGREDLLNAGSSSTASRNRPTDFWPADHSRDRVRPGDCPGGSTSWRTAGAPSSAGRRDVRSSSRLGPGSHRHMKRSTLCPRRCRSKPSRSCPVGAPDGRDRIGGRLPRGCSHPHQRKPSPMI